MTVRRQHRPQLSLLVPFRPDPNSPHRARLWEWLERYWSYELPDAEIVMGNSRGKVFSKAVAVNSAARKAHGRIFAIMDADVFMLGDDILNCARQIDQSLRRDHPLWFVPYRRLYRLTEESTEEVLASDPRRPLRFHSPPPGELVGPTTGSAFGHFFGAMIQIIPREGFEAVGGWQERFRGWGSEDVVQVRVQDTLYGRHKTSSNDVLHLWHERIGDGFMDRMWAGQDTPRLNERLAQRYHRANYDYGAMRALVDEDLGTRRRRRGAVDPC